MRVSPYARAMRCPVLRLAFVPVHAEHGRKELVLALSSSHLNLAHVWHDYHALRRNLAHPSGSSGVLVQIPLCSYAYCVLPAYKYPRVDAYRYWVYYSPTRSCITIPLLNWCVVLPDSFALSSTLL
eukprot:3156135-Rhodomonas_salina.3